MTSHADPNPAGWTDEEWAGMLRDAEAEVESLRDELAKAKRVATNSAAENQQLREALRRLLAHHDDGCASPFPCAAAEDVRAAVGKE